MQQIHIHTWVLIFQLFPLLASAQLKEFAVSEMERPDVAVVQANTQWPDDALLLVYSSLDGLQFRSSMGAVDKQTYNNTAGRYEILVKAVKQMVFVAKPGYIELKVATINPKPKDVFYFAVERIQTGLHMARYGTISINTNPAGSQVYINGVKMANQTPFEGEILAQDYRLSLRKQDYVSVDTVITVSSSNKTVVNMELNKLDGSLTINSTPENALVYVDDKYWGKTPLSGTKEVGQLKVELRLTGYESQTRIVQIQDDNNQSIHFELVKQGSSLCVDPKGREYETVQIGNEVWMSENLAYKVSMDKCWAFRDDLSKVEKYGYLYDWRTANDACPAGWHLPSIEEWKKLAEQLGGYGEEVNRLALKRNGFKGIFGGYRSSDGNFSELGKVGYWWSSSSKNSAYGIGIFIGKKSGKIYKNTYSKTNGFSVRCIKD